MNYNHPTTADELDAICDCETDQHDTDAVTDLLIEAAGITSDREGLISTIHLAISERAWQLRDADEDAEDPDEARDIVAACACQTADLLTLLNLVLTVYPAAKNPRFS